MAVSGQLYFYFIYTGNIKTGEKYRKLRWAGYTDGIGRQMLNLWKSGHLEVDKEPK
jgi:hypothetical protein